MGSIRDSWGEFNKALREARRLHRDRAPDHEIQAMLAYARQNLNVLVTTMQTQSVSSAVAGVPSIANMEAAFEATEVLVMSPRE